MGSASLSDHAATEDQLVKSKSRKSSRKVKRALLQTGNTISTVSSQEISDGVISTVSSKRRPDELSLFDRDNRRPKITWTGSRGTQSPRQLTVRAAPSITIIGGG